MESLTEQTHRATKLMKFANYTSKEKAQHFSKTKETYLAITCEKRLLDCLNSKTKSDFVNVRLERWKQS